MIPLRGIGDGGRSVVAKLESVASREALAQQVVECTALEMRRRCKYIGGSNPSLSATNSSNMLILLSIIGWLVYRPTFCPTDLCGWSQGAPGLEKGNLTLLFTIPTLVACTMLW
jgi:hypothetical protein